MSRCSILQAPLLVLSLSTAMLLTLAGCGAARTTSEVAQPFARAIDEATDALVQQTQGPAFLANLGKRTVVLDPTLDAAVCWPLAASQQLDRAVAERIRQRFDAITVLPFQASSLANAQYLLVGTLTRTTDDYRLSLAMVDLKDGQVKAQSSTVANRVGVDMSPLPYYRDSPVLVKDKVVDGYVRTSTTPPGQPADAAYLERIATATVINDATVIYNAARYREALGQYRSALAAPAGDQIRSLTALR